MTAGLKVIHQKETTWRENLRRRNDQTAWASLPFKQRDGSQNVDTTLWSLKCSGTLRPVNYGVWCRSRRKTGERSENEKRKLETKNEDLIGSGLEKSLLQKSNHPTWAVFMSSPIMNN